MKPEDVKIADTYLRRLDGAKAALKDAVNMTQVEVSIPDTGTVIRVYNDMRGSDDKEYRDTSDAFLSTVKEAAIAFYRKHVEVIEERLTNLGVELPDTIPPDNTQGTEVITQTITPALNSLPLVEALRRSK